MRDPDILTGATWSAAGGTGLTIQYITDFGSLVVVVLNIALALAGLALIGYKIRKAHLEIVERPPSGKSRRHI